jgi:hypothetical protein
MTMSLSKRFNIKSIEDREKNFDVPTHRLNGQIKNPVAFVTRICLAVKSVQNLKF